MTTPKETNGDVENIETNTNNPLKGQVYWIRHGESEGNEKNIFSGVVDFRLTRYGELQGRRAGIDLDKKFGSKGGQFDAVYTSNLYRAIRTKQLALSEDDTTKRSPMLKDSTYQTFSTDICERSQGIFTGENKSLVMALMGIHLFNEFLEDASHCPLGGESGGEIYDRCKAFYEREIQPRTDRGENVLIVCHEFVMMGMVCYLSGAGRSDFVEFKVPNGKALSSEELISLLQTQTNEYNDFLKELGNWTTVNALKYAILLYIVGGLVRVASQSDQGFPTWLFRTLIIVLNFFSSLYTYLDVDLYAVPKNVSGIAVIAVVANVFALRWTTALVALDQVEVTPGDVAGELLQAWMIYLMIPPGMTSPGVSKLTGGNVYECATLSPVLSLVMPLLLWAFADYGLIPDGIIDTGNLGFYWGILAGGLWLPCALSQYARWNSPVESAKHTKLYSFLTGWSLMGLGFVGGFQNCPTDFFIWIKDVNNSDAETQNLSPLSWAFGIWLALRITGTLMQQVLHRFTDLLPRQLVDIFVLVTTPNFFLWLSLATSNDDPDAPTGNIVNFWAGFFFFGGIAFEQLLGISSVGRKLCRAAVGGTVMSPEKVDDLLKLYDRDGSHTLDKEEFSDLLKHFFRNSGEPVPHKKIFEGLLPQMMKHLGAKNGEVPVSKAREYLLSNGLYVNLNSESLADQRASGVLTGSQVPRSPTKMWSRMASTLFGADHQKTSAKRLQRQSVLMRATSARGSIVGGLSHRTSSFGPPPPPPFQTDTSGRSSVASGDGGRGTSGLASPGLPRRTTSRQSACGWVLFSHGDPDLIAEDLKDHGIMDNGDNTVLEEDEEDEYKED